MVWPRLPIIQRRIRVALSQLSLALYSQRKRVLLQRESRLCLLLRLVPPGCWSKLAHASWVICLNWQLWLAISRVILLLELWVLGWVLLQNQVSLALRPRYLIRRIVILLRCRTLIVASIRLIASLTHLLLIACHLLSRHIQMQITSRIYIPVVGVHGILILQRPSVHVIIWPWRHLAAGICRCICHWWLQIAHSIGEVDVCWLYF